MPHRTGARPESACFLMSATQDNMTITARIRQYIRDNFLYGGDARVSDDGSLLEAGVIDSTGAMELVVFLESEFGISVDDRDLVPENLDSISRIASFVTRRLGDGRAGSPLAATS